MRVPWPPLRPRGTTPGRKARATPAAFHVRRRAKKLRDIATSLKREEMATGKTRKWRRQAGELNKQVNLIVKDEETLSKSFPQGEQREALWILITLGYYVKLLGGLVGGAISIIWLIHMIVYLFIKPPASPFLNQFFIAFQASPAALPHPAMGSCVASPPLATGSRSPAPSAPFGTNVVLRVRRTHGACWACWSSGPSACTWWP